MSFINILTFILTGAVTAGTPLLFATLGELITEKVGQLNLGVEGMMLIGAVIGFSAALSTENPVLGIMAGMIAGACGALIFAFLTITLRANQIVSGLSLTIFGTGFSSFVGQKMIGQGLADSVRNSFAPIKLPLLGDIPVLGSALFNQNILVYVGYITAVVLAIYLYKTRIGLNLRMVGENPGAADTAGINVSLYKYLHILLGGALCGIGGAYMSLITVPSWQDGVTGGRGWIAVALVIFVTWNPYKAMLGSYFFGALSILGLYLQSYVHIPQSFFDMLPYIATIVVLIMISMKKSKENNPPKALGEPYFREDR
ncbi:MAG: putative ABC-type transport system, permease component [Eubacterium sp.]|jgi:simple sugar transport system permease protein|nr:putative ABC-type transport system, permease component [Eubacterium sp.]